MDYHKIYNIIWIYQVWFSVVYRFFWDILTILRPHPVISCDQISPNSQFVQFAPGAGATNPGTIGFEQRRGTKRCGGFHSGDLAWVLEQVDHWESGQATVFISPKMGRVFAERQLMLGWIGCSSFFRKPSFHGLKPEWKTAWMDQGLVCQLNFWRGLSVVWCPHKKMIRCNKFFRQGKYVD